MKSSHGIPKLILSLLLSLTVITVSAKGKDRFLPSSTTSEAAKASYSKAIDRLVNANHDQYIQFMKEALQADPNYFMAQANLALTSLDDKSGDKKIDKSELRKALDIPQANLTDAEKIVRKILVKIDEDPNADLTPLTDELVNAYPGTMEAWGLSRSIAFIENDDETVFRCSQKLVELDPEFGPAHNALGYAYMSKGQMDMAKKEFEEYLRLSPNEANAHDSMGEFYMKTGDYAKSAEHYNQAVAMGMNASKKYAEKATALANGDDPAKWLDEDEMKEKNDDSQRGN